MSSKKNKLLESAQKNIQKGQYARAINEYQEIIRLDSADVRHRQRLAELLTKADRKDEAVKEYQFLAKHYVDNVHYVKAIAVYKQIQKLEPVNAETSLILAELNEKQGLAGNAATEYSLAIQIFEKNGENLKALKVLESMLALDPQNLAIRLRIAEKYFSTGNESKSFNEFLSLAQALKELNDESGLNHVIERTTKIYPQRAAELLAAVSDKTEEPVVVKPVVPPAAAPPKTAPPPIAPAPIAPAPIAPAPIAPAPIAPAPIAPAPVTEPLAPVKQKPTTAPSAESRTAPEQLPDEPFIVEHPEDDLIEDILPITELEEDQRVDTEVPSDEPEWEEEIDIGSLECDSPEVYAAEITPEVSLIREIAAEEIQQFEEIQELEELQEFEEIQELEELQEYEEIQELEEAQDLEETNDLEKVQDLEVELELDIEIEPEYGEIADSEPSPVPEELEESELPPEPEEPAESELPPEQEEPQEPELPPEQEEPQEPELPPEQEEPQESELPTEQEEPADSSVDLANDLSMFADEIDFDLMQMDSSDAASGFDAFSSYTTGDLDREDSESHYSLGLAYKEMSLFEDAIAEFAVASRSPERKIDCFILQALCFKENGKVAAAIMLLNETLEEPDLTENQLVSIKYELALCHEEAGEKTEAKRLYSEIVTLRPDFNDAVERLTNL